MKSSSVLKLAPVRSSTVAAVGYDQAHRWLDVLYVKGIRYRYLNVPSTLHDQLMAAPSKGAFVNRFIKGHYLYTVVDGS